MKAYASRNLALTACFLGVMSAAQPYEAPTMRHVNYVAISAPRGSRAKCSVACASHGYRAYQDSLKCRLVSPDGFVAASVLAPPGRTSQIDVPVTWEGRCAIEANSGWNLASVQFQGDTPHAYLSKPNRPLKTVRGWGPLYFYVPKATRYFNVWIHASVRREGLHLVIRNPQGEVVREEDGDFDQRTKLQIMLPRSPAKPLDAAAWSITLSKPQAKGMVLDDVYVELGRHLPPFLAPKPEWAKLFAGDWRYDPKADRPRAQLKKADPKRKPFPGASGPDVDRAYSRDTAKGWRTTLPFTYVLDYGAKHLGHGDYIPAVATAPPVLLHLGKDVPFNHGWGPVQALGGENQAYGYGDSIKRLSPEEVSKRIAGLTQMVEGLHKSGVRWVMPYICAMTLNGDEKKRAGFWEFYDHWDDYRGLGLAPKPQADPYDWLQRKPDGTVLIYYGYDPKKSYYPPFKTNHRYAACWRTPGWRTWLCEVVRFTARCGQDGVFVDNGCSQRCQCPRCLQAFREYLKQTYAPERARNLFGPIEQVAFPDKPGSLLHVEMTRYWCATLRDELATLKAVGTKELGREFIVFPNGGRPEYIQLGLRDADFVMFEKSIGNYGTHPGLVMSPVFEDMYLRAYNDNIFEYKFVQCLQRRVKPIILSRAGYPRRLPWLMLNENSARLGMAECGAFSGGGGFLLRPRFDVYCNALNEYRAFFETHPQLYAGMEPYAQVAVLTCPEQSWYGNRAHIARARAVTDSLTEAHALLDYVAEDRLTQPVLRSYTALVAAELHYVSDAHLRLIAEWVKDGGKLVVIGDFATHDDAMAKRDPAAGEWQPLLRLTAGQGGRLGRGHVAKCTGPADAPASLAAAMGQEPAVLACPHERLAPHVKVNAFRGEGRLVFHVVNYNVPLGVDAPEPAGIQGIVLDVPLPPGARVTSATCYAPDEARAAALEVQAVAGRAKMRLPALRVYQVVEVPL